jgi:hypothetical protein
MGSTSDLTEASEANALAAYLGPGRSKQQADIHYDPRFIANVARHYGWDAVWGIFAHEVGHAHLGIFDLYESGYTDENSADYIAGFLLAKNGISLDPFILLLTKINTDDGVHPHTTIRLNTIARGYQDYVRNSGRLFEQFLVNRHRGVDIA